MAASKDWDRLAEFVRERRTDLGMTQEDARGVGGPSTATMRLIEGALQQSYQPSTLRDLEKALRWERGSVRSILAGGDPVPVPDTVASVPPAAPEPPREVPADDAGAMTSGIVIAALPWMERQVWAHIRRCLQATPSGAALFADPAQTALWPADSAPITLTPEAIQVLEAIPAAALFSDPVEELTWRLEMDPPHQRVREIASRRAARWSLRRPTRPARRAG